MLSLYIFLLSCILVSGSDLNLARTNSQIKIPKIQGDYIHIYKPDGDVFPGPQAPELKVGKYYDEWVPNDHCFIKGKDGRWHVFGITHPRTGLKNVHSGEYLSFHAVAPHGKLKDVLHESTWVDQPKVLPPSERPNENVLNHAPYIIRKNDQYHMIYGPAPLRYAVSKDLYNWVSQGELTNPPSGRDPSLLFWNESYHIMVCGRYEVKMAASNDLINCEENYSIIKMKDHVDPESPSIIPYNGTFYLFVCGWNGISEGNDLNSAYQHITYVYQSDDPYHFDANNEVTRLNAHAPEIFQDEEGDWYISSVQWPNRGVSIARLVWGTER